MCTDESTYTLRCEKGLWILEEVSLSLLKALTVNARTHTAMMYI